MKAEDLAAEYERLAAVAIGPELLFTERRLVKARAIRKVIEERDRLRAQTESMELVLEAYVSDFCEGFCADLPLDYADNVMLNDCSGCRARVCLATEPKP